MHVTTLITHHYDQPTLRNCPFTVFLGGLGGCPSPLPQDPPHASPLLAVVDRHRRARPWPIDGVGGLSLLLSHTLHGSS